MLCLPYAGFLFKVFIEEKKPLFVPKKITAIAILTKLMGSMYQTLTIFLILNHQFDMIIVKILN